MKKPKTQKVSATSVSAKKSGVLKHQMLFTPYKIEWKNIQPSSGQQSSRTFFNTMKNDLNNLKNDVERMIKKEVGKSDIKIPKPQPLQQPDLDNVKQSQSAHRVMSSTCKLQTWRGEPESSTKKVEMKNVCFENIQNFTEQRDSQNRTQIQIKQKQLREKQQQMEAVTKQNRLQKNLISELKKQNHELYNEIEQKHKNQHELLAEVQKLTNQKQIQVERLSNEINLLTKANSQLQVNIIQLTHQNKQLLCKLQANIKPDQSECDQLKRTNEELRSHNQFLQEKIEDLSEKMSMVSSKFKEKQCYIKQLEAKVEAIKISKHQMEIQFEEEKKQIDYDWSKKLSEKNNEFSYRLQQQLKKCQQQFMEQIEYIQQGTKQAVEALEQQNLSFSQRIKQLQQQVKRKQQCNKIQSHQNLDFKQLGAEFERKINQLVEQNYALKNKNTSLESQIQSMNAYKQALEQEIKLFEELQADRKQGKNSSSSQWEKTLFQMHNLKKQKDNLIEEFEYKIMKLENELQQQKNRKEIKADDCVISGTGFNKILKDQLQENQDLKQKVRQYCRQQASSQIAIKQLQQKLSLVSQQLSIERMKSQILDKKVNGKDQSEKSCSEEVVNSLKYDLDLLKKKYEALNSMLDSKNKQIKSKDEFIERVLISKVGKKEQEEDIAYILRTISSHC